MKKYGMATQNEIKTTAISSGAIFFGALIGIGLFITLGVFGAALGLSAGSEMDQLPSGVPGIVIALVSAIILSAPFLAAGYIASKISHQRLRFDSVIHSLGTWAIMAIFLMVLVSFASAAEGLRRGFNGMNIRMVTDIHVLQGTADTTVKPGNTKTEQPTPEDKKQDALFTAALWVFFASLICGAGMSLVGGLLGRPKN